MKKLFSILLLVALAGCTTNGVYDSGKTWTLIGAVAVGGYAASQGGSDKTHGPDCYVIVTPNGSDHVCR